MINKKWCLLALGFSHSQKTEADNVQRDQGSGPNETDDRKAKGCKIGASEPIDKAFEARPKRLGEIYDSEGYHIEGR